MKKLSKIIILLSILILSVSCEEIPKNIDANLLEITFEGQIGISQTDFINPVLTCTIFGDDLSKVKIKRMIISENATSSIKVGETLSFNNASSSATIKITSETGIEKTYTIIADKFGVPAFVGNWTLTTDCYFNYTYCDDQGNNCGEMYWGNLSSDDYGTYFLQGAAIYDNTLKIAYTNMDESGNLNGTYQFGAGADNKIGSFEHKTANGTILDLNKNFGRLFPGNGTWKWNTMSDQITFYNSDKSDQSLTYSNSGDMTHWKAETLDDGSTKLTIWITVNRKDLPDVHDAWLQYGYTDTAWTLAGYVISFSMILD